MRTPIAAFLREYSTRGGTRLHMPGHKGRGFTPEISHDITEISGADVLYTPESIILESERLTAAIFGTARTLYSTEGSSLSLKAMLALAVFYAKENGEKPLILAARNAHKSFLHAATLLDFDIEWIFGDSVISTAITKEILCEKLSKMQRKPTALFLTSPDYLGNALDILALSAVCHEYGVLLLVDNAHGAYLKFLPHDMHPITLGADACCDSAHKTLPALTGAGYLHISKTAPKTFTLRADEAMALFASTSPSYLILESLDLLTEYLASGYKEKLASFLPIRDEISSRLENNGYSVLKTEPLKISVATKSYGYTGDEIAKILEEKRIFVEFHDPDFLVVMLSPEQTWVELLPFLETLLLLEKRSAIETSAPKPPKVERKMTPRAAAFSQTELVKTDLALGRVLSAASVSCPPAVPILVSGEVITSEAIDALKYYGIEKIRVVK